MASPITDAERQMLAAYDIFLALLSRWPAAAQSLAAEAAALAERYETANRPDRRRHTVRATEAEQETNQCQATYSP
jgi:hypothetical protein